MNTNNENNQPHSTIQSSNNNNDNNNNNNNNTLSSQQQPQPQQPQYVATSSAILNRTQSQQLKSRTSPFGSSNNLLFQQEHQEREQFDEYEDSTFQSISIDNDNNHHHHHHPQYSMFRSTSSPSSNLLSNHNNNNNMNNNSNSISSVLGQFVSDKWNNNNNNNSSNGDLLPGFDASISAQKSASRLKKIVIVLLCALALMFIYHVNSLNGLTGTTAAGNTKIFDFQDLEDRDKFSVRSEDDSRSDYPIVLCADRDSYSFNSKSHAWTSLLIEGTLKRDADTGMYTAHFPKDPTTGQVQTTPLEGKLAEGKRGLELSELKRFNGRLYTVDDRTGIVYEIMDKDPKTNKRKVVARYILNDGDGHTDKGFKSEWATVKDNKLYVGSIGKEWTTGTGEVISHNPMYVKSIDLNGSIKSINWVKQYTALRDAAGVPFPGYMVHESAEWSDFYKRWFFLPRRVSKLSYDEVKDVNRGSNIMIAASEDFKSISIKRIGDLTPTRGFSSFKFIPGRPREIVAIKSEEVGEKMSSYITVFTTSGKILLPETLIAEEKIEGIEIE